MSKYITNCTSMQMTILCLTHNATCFISPSPHTQHVLSAIWLGLAGKAFCALLHDSDVAFEELYCSCFALLDRIWLQRRASYMEFNSVMQEVKAQLDKALRRRPKTLTELRQHLHSSL